MGATISRQVMCLHTNTYFVSVDQESALNTIAGKRPTGFERAGTGDFHIWASTRPIFALISSPDEIPELAAQSARRWGCDAVLVGRVIHNITQTSFVGSKVTTLTPREYRKFRDAFKKQYSVGIIDHDIGFNTQ